MPEYIRTRDNSDHDAKYRELRETSNLSFERGAGRLIRIDGVITYFSSSVWSQKATIKIVDSEGYEYHFIIHSRHTQGLSEGQHISVRARPKAVGWERIYLNYVKIDGHQAPRRTGTRRDPMDTELEELKLRGVIWE